MTNQNEDKLKDKILSYERERSIYRIEDTHKRQTFLIDNENIKRLESLQAYLELQNAKNSTLSNEDEQTIQRQRKLAIGFKTKAVNIALDKFFEDWESEYGDTPDVETIRYKVANTNNNYRVYFFEDNGTYHFIQHDNRGNQLAHIYDTNEKKIRDKFESYRETEIRSGRPNK